MGKYPNTDTLTIHINKKQSQHFMTHYFYSKSTIY